MTREQARGVVDAVGKRRDGPRNRAHLVVLYRAGLRVLESCLQDVEDFMPNGSGASVVRVTHPKGEGSWGIHRYVGMDAQATAIVMAWLEVRGAGGGPLFWTRSKRPVHPTHVRRVLRSAARQVGITRRIHPHALRHTFARELYDEGKRIREIQLVLGHNSLATTELYLQSIGATEAVAATTDREDW